MTSSKLLVPLRVPELGPALGKLITGSGRTAGPLPLNRVRRRIVGRLIDAAGEARRLAAKEERGAALAAVSPQVWLDTWEEAVGAVSGALADYVDGRLDAEAVAVRMSGRARRDLPLDASERRALAGRLGAAGAALVSALDAIELHAGRLLDATVRDRQELDAWQSALALAARRLEAAWLALEDQVTIELAQWEAVAERVAQWRRSWWPVAAVGLPVFVAALWLGLILGGYVASPRWLESLWQLVS